MPRSPPTAMPTAARNLEDRLIAALKGNLSRDAHDYVCRKLAIVGTAAARADLGRTLARQQERRSHMARYALERITAPRGRAGPA